MMQFLKKMRFPYHVEHVENYRIVKGAPNEEALMDLVSKCDLLVINLTRSENWLNELGRRLVAEVVPKSAQVIRVPYVYNHGQHPLCSKDTKSGPLLCFGEDELRDYFKSRPIDRVFKDYRTGKIDFCLRARFLACLEEQRSREESCDVKLVDFMREHSRERLMLTYNHPTSIVMHEAASQIMRLTGYPVAPVTIENENEVGLPGTEPLSHYVVREFGMRRSEDAGASPFYLRRVQEAYLRAQAS